MLLPILPIEVSKEHQMKKSRALYYLIRLLELWKKILWLWRNFQETYVRSLILQANIEHMYGDEEISYSMNELIVLCVARDGELYVKSFIEHHLAMGVKHIVILDNNSIDNMVAIAKKYSRVTILRTKLTFKKYENVMRRYLVSRFSRSRWNLMLDIDELFDYPYSNLSNLESFLNYLNQNSYTAVVCQLLDMFSDKSLASFTSSPEDSFKETYPFYNISSIEKNRYPSAYGSFANNNIYWHTGGIRKKLFGTDNCLSKIHLTFIDDKIKTFIDFHQVLNASIADITCVLFHYPFTSTFYNKVKDSVADNRYLLGAFSQYQSYWKILKVEPDINIKDDTAYKLTNTNSLIDNEFLVVSESYIDWVKKIADVERAATLETSA